MTERKLKILFHGDILSRGLIRKASKSNGRTGIFFTAYNILAEFLKRDDVEIFICVNCRNERKVRRFCQLAFPDKQLNYLSSDVSGNLAERYVFFKNARSYYKTHKNFFSKIWCNLNAAAGKWYIRVGNCFCRRMILKRFADCDLIFSPLNLCPDIGLPKYTLLHDTIPRLFPEYYPKAKGNVYDILRHTKFEDHHFANSLATKNDFIRFCPTIDPEKIVVTPLACNERFVPADENAIASAREKYHIPAGKKYILSLCTLDPRKNLIRAVKTFVEFVKKNNIDDLVFVLGGGHWDEFIGKLEAEISNLGDYRDKIIRGGYIDDEDVPPLYSGAQWFVYTSQYEGFGLPPLEAMSCGCPVITSNNSSLPEVVGDAGIMIDFDSDSQHIKAYEDYYFNPALRAEYAARGLAHAKNFSWAKCAGMMIDEMKKVTSR